MFLKSNGKLKYRKARSLPKLNYALNQFVIIEFLRIIELDYVIEVIKLGG